jgi:hypothetical protein
MLLRTSYIIGILNIRKHNVLEIGSISVFMCGEGDTYSAVFLRRIYPASVDRNVVFYSYLDFWTMDQVHKPSDSEDNYSCFVTCSF